jgi:hypothetical protein
MPHIFVALVNYDHRHPVALRSNDGVGGRGRGRRRATLR